MNNDRTLVETMKKGKDIHFCPVINGVPTSSEGGVTFKEMVSEVEEWLDGIGRRIPSKEEENKGDGIFRYGFTAGPEPDEDEDREGWI